MNNLTVQHINKEITHRVIALLDRRQVDFLDKLGKDAMFTTKHKLSHNDIIKALVDFAMELGISADGVDSVAKLRERIKEKFGGAR